jgi:poly-gamma-glutamate capsule biosynthesis protein CapA/YwtB (metallophosphatase superfamily)
VQNFRMRFRLVCLGDVMLARGVSHVLSSSDPLDLWGDTLPIISDADLRLANLECCISDRGEPFWPPRTFYFRAIPKAIDTLVGAGIDVVTLANNHSLDFGSDALADTLERLDRAGISHAGAGRDLDSAREPAILESGGRRVGVIGVTDNYPEYAASAESPGTFHLEIELGSLDLVVEAIERARKMDAELVVVSAHVGPNMVTRPPKRFREFARAVLDAGADLWFGHSAHVFQGVEFYRGKPVIYDGGDFLDDYATDPILRNDRSLIWKVEWSAADVAVEAYPVRLSFAQTDLARGEDFDWIEARLTELCSEMGTVVERRDDRLRLEPEEGGREN